jgi:hypothetical protein
MSAQVKEGHPNCVFATAAAHRDMKGLVQERAKEFVGWNPGNLLMEAMDQIARSGFPVHDVGAKDLMIENVPADVAFRRRSTDQELKQVSCALVCVNQVPVAIQNDGRVRLLLFEDELNRAFRLHHLRIAVDEIYRFLGQMSFDPGSL